MSLILKKTELYCVNISSADKGTRSLPACGPLQHAFQLLFDTATVTVQLAAGTLLCFFAQSMCPCPVSPGSEDDSSKKGMRPYSVSNFTVCGYLISSTFPVMESGIDKVYPILQIFFRIYFLKHEIFKSKVLASFRPECTVQSQDKRTVYSTRGTERKNKNKNKMQHSSFYSALKKKFFLLTLPPNFMVNKSILLYLHGILFSKHPEI